MSATFTISQSPSLKMLWLYPNGDSATQLSAEPAGTNYTTVDDTRLDYDTDTYVYTTNISTVSDLYNLENHTTELGSINSITVFARAKSHQYGQSSSGTFDILLDDGFGNVSKSSEATYPTNIQLTTGYNLYSCLWKSNPTNSEAWTWTDVDNLLIGMKCSSPTITRNYSFIFRPEDGGEFAQLGQIPSSGSHYDKVDDTTPDDDSTYLWWNTSSSQKDMFVMENHTTQAGVINHMTLFVRWKAYRSISAGGLVGYMKPLVNTYNTEYEGTQFNDYQWGGYKVDSYKWENNPSTSNPWTWTEIDNLQAGCKIRTNSGEKSTEGVRVTQIYIVVNSNEAVNPEIRTTQMYARVKYTPSTTSCYLTKPSTYDYNHNREIKKLNFWNGDRSVYDLQRNNKTLTMTGMEYIGTTSEATIRLKCVKDMEQNGSEIEISGMDDPNLNTTWQIKSFEYRQNDTNPNIYDWVLEAEKI